MSPALVFVFPGQGSQQLGMLSELAVAHPIIQETFAEASQSLGYDLWHLVQSGPEERLNSTEVTQPALLTASVALWRLWKQQEGKQPAMMAGHSLGEYSALVSAGALSLAAGVKLVQLRGELMQKAVPAGTGAMAAILGLDDAAVTAACIAAEEGQIVAPVNFNCPGQVVIAGEKTAVERAMQACKTSGAKRAIPLAVSVPSHCRLMQPIAQEMADALAEVELAMPEIPVVQNVTAQLPDSLQALRENLVSQLYHPVLWTDSVRMMVAEGASVAVECGPGKVLCGLNKKIDKSLEVISLTDSVSFEKALSLV